MLELLSKMQKHLQEPVNSQNPLEFDILGNPMSLEFNSLISCNCCDRHKLNRPTYISKLYERRPTFKNKDKYICQCTCRQKSRQICRDFYGSVIINDIQYQ